MADPYFKNVRLQLRANQERFLTLNLNSADSIETYSTFILTSKFGPPGTLSNTVVFDNTFSFKFTPGSPIASHYDSGGALRVFNNTDFTFDFKFYLNSLNTGSNTTLLDAIYSGIAGIKIVVNSSGFLGVYMDSATPILTSSEVILPNTKYHVEISRGSGTLRLFLNGILNTTATKTNSLTSYSNMIISFGGRYQSRFPADDADGYFDDFRSTFGICRHTSDFTPPLANEYSEFSLDFDLYKKENINIPGIPLKETNNKDFYIDTDLKYFPHFQGTVFSFGDEVLTGIASLDGVPGRYKLSLFVRDRKILFQTTMSEADGSYIFNNLEKDIYYTLLCEDHLYKGIRKNAAIRDLIKL
jgi:hypothetical protein